jgi:hypothetical protein
MTLYLFFCFFDILLTCLNGSNGTVSWLVLFQFDLEHSNLVRTCTYQISARSDFKYGRQVAILENQLRAIDMQLCTYVPLGNINSQSSLILNLAKTENTKSAINPGLMAGSSSNLGTPNYDT